MKKLPQYHTESQGQNIWSQISRIQQCHLGRPVISNIYPLKKKKKVYWPTYGVLTGSLRRPTSTLTCNQHNHP